MGTVILRDAGYWVQCPQKAVKSDPMAHLWRRQLGSEEIEIVGMQPSAWANDLYHLLIRAPWWVDLVALSAAFLGANVLFAVAFTVVGGVEGAHSFGDRFFFSVQTMGTIGYGAMYPRSTGAEIIVTVSSLTQIFLTAVTTGLVFSKFSIPRARVQFALHPVMTPYDGLPTLQFRIGNQRDSRMLEAVVRVVYIRTERTREGVTMYRMYDLRLERERSPALARSWTVLHKIEGDSPLVGASPESLQRDEGELILTLTGTDEASAQPLHAQQHYYADSIRWGYRHADMLSERSDGRLQLDMNRFHELVTTVPCDGFPYGEGALPRR
jgi:inward rectifier potassium channel